MSSSPASPAALTAEILAQLKARHLAFLEARLVSAEAAVEWRAQVGAACETLLAARVGQVVEASAVTDALDAVLTGEAVERVARPLAKRLLPVLLAEARAQKGTVRERVPAATQQRIDAFMARPGLVPERLLNEIVDQDAIDEIMRDVLYDGFKEFSEKVNPFTAEWGIPSLLKRMSVFGGAMAKGVETVKVEFDRRLEPEIRRFLGSFSRRGLRRLVELTIARADQPTSIAFRKHLVGWVLDQEIAALAREADEEALALGREIGLDVAAAELARAETTARRRAWIEATVAAAKDLTVGEALAALGVTLRLDTASIAAASWPAVATVLGSAEVKAWIARLLGEFYDAEAKAAATA
jgi:hypothetical protein